jgi:hypothetical protein
VRPRFFAVLHVGAINRKRMRCGRRSSLEQSEVKTLALILAIGSALCGGWAARKWYAASRVNVVPFEMRGGRLVEVETAYAQVWIKALKSTLEKSGNENKRASLWTAASIALARLAAIASALSQSN